MVSRAQMVKEIFTKLFRCALFFARLNKWTSGILHNYVTNQNIMACLVSQSVISFS